MRRVVTVVLACAGLSLALGQPASAADMTPVYKAPAGPVAVPYNWSGIYFGGFAGGGWGNKDWTEVVGPFPGRQISPDLSGFLGGAQAGFNYQIGNWVLGVEGDYGWSNLEGSSTCIAGPPFLCSAEMRSLATFTGRVGYAFDNVMLYMKGGGAWARDHYDVSNFGIVLSNARDNKSGWTVGGGLEYGFTPNWSVKAEYDYSRLATDRVTFTNGAVQNIGQDVHTVKFGINYRFGWTTPVR